MKTSEVSVDGMARPAKGTGSAAAGNVVSAKNSTTTEAIRKRIVMLPPGGGDGYNGQGNEPPRGSFPSRDRNCGDGVPKKPPSPAVHSCSLRGPAKLRAEMLQPRHHFVLQQPQRIVPGLRLVLVVEAKHQKRAKTADLAVDFLDLVGDGGRRADDPV